MIKRTIEISREAAHLTTKHKQMLVKRDDAIAGAVPCEDIGMVVVDHQGTTYSHALLTELLRNKATLLICGRDHLPAGLLLPLSEHSEVVWRIKDQISVSKPTQKRIWQQIIQAKIRAQASVLDRESAAHRKLIAYSKKVRSGDPENIEAQAARTYWRNFLSDEQRFYRDQNGDGLNSFLNYGYAIVRAAIARAIVSAGLLPAIGIHHRNRSNSFCLADDLIEPFRPLADFLARDLFEQGFTELTPEAKRELLSVLTIEVVCDGETGPLAVSLHRMVASLVRCFSGQSKDILIPDYSEFVTNPVNAGTSI